MTENTFRAECGCVVTVSSDAWNITHCEGYLGDAYGPLPPEERNVHLEGLLVELVQQAPTLGTREEEFERRFTRIKEDPFQVILGIYEGWNACWALHHPEPSLADCGKAYEEWLRTEQVPEFLGRYQAFHTGWMAARRQS